MIILVNHDNKRDNTRNDSKGVPVNSFKEDQPKIPLSSVWLLGGIAEYKGKQALYKAQSPQILKTLLETALIESSESSNRIEGVTVDRNRLKPLVIGQSKPRDRSEEEVAGYRKALDFIHKKHKTLCVTPETIQKLHALCRGKTWDSGKWKEKTNDIIKKPPDGRVEIIFKPLSAKKTPEAMKQLCLSYEYSVTQMKYPELYAIGCLVFDFLSIHPFRDGNGRVSRLLTLLALYQHDYDVGGYISLERIIEESKETHYESLNKSSQEWHESKHDVFPWINYFLGTILAAYKEFENRAKHSSPAKGVKTEIIISEIKKQGSEFTLTDIACGCPGVSRPMIRVVLEKLRDEGKLKVLGAGRGARWKKRDNKL